MIPDRKGRGMMPRGMSLKKPATKALDQHRGTTGPSNGSRVEDNLFDPNCKTPAKLEFAQRLEKDPLRLHTPGSALPVRLA